jgi:hypothetical protein
MAETIYRQEKRTIDIWNVCGHGNSLVGADSALRQLDNRQIGRLADKHATEEDLAILRIS